MRSFLIVLALTLATLAALPPLWFSLFPVTPPPLPAPGRRVEVAPGVAVNLIEAGAGPPVVLVHGHPGSAYDWRPLMKELAAQGYRAVAYDRVGYGHSDARERPSLVADNAAELLALLEAEGLLEVTLVGSSYGGATAITATRMDPARIARLVLVGSVGPGIEDRPAPPSFVIELLVGPVLSWISVVPPLSDRFRHFYIGLAFEPEPVPPEFLTLAAANFGAPDTLATFRTEGRDLDGTADLDPSAIALPILVVQGDGDQLVPPEVGETLHRLAPRSELWLVPGGGHMLAVTRPDALAERIDAFATTR